MTIIDQIISAKIARNAFHAAAIANGLRLWELDSDAERMKRVRLYRAWRDAGEIPAVAFANALSDRRAPDPLPGMPALIGQAAEKGAG